MDHLSNEDFFAEAFIETMADAAPAPSTAPAAPAAPAPAAAPAGAPAAAAAGAAAAAAPAPAVKPAAAPAAPAAAPAANATAARPANATVVPGPAAGNATANATAHANATAANATAANATAANATAANATQYAPHGALPTTPSHPEFKPLTKPTPPPAPPAAPPAPVIRGNDHGKEKPAPPERIPNTRAYAIVKFSLELPNSMWSENKIKFQRELITEITKGLNLPRHRFSIVAVNAGIDVAFRVNQLRRLDNRAAPHAQDVASLFKELAMSPQLPWRNLPKLSKVDRSKPITFEVKEQAPPPREKSQSCQMRIAADVRMIEPMTAEFIKAFEIDVATATHAEPEQIQVTAVTPDEDGTSMHQLIVEFQVHARRRPMPEKEVTPTGVVHLLRQMLPNTASRLRISPITRNADPFFPVQNIMPKPKPLAEGQWLHIPAMYTTGEILPDPPVYERPLVLPTLLVQPPAAPKV